MAAPTGELAQFATGDVVIVDNTSRNSTYHIDAHGNIRPADDSGDRYIAGTAALLMYVARPFPQNLATALPSDRWTTLATS